METVGQRIKKLRAELGMSQAMLADKLGAGVSTVASWEVDKRVPSRENIELLSEIFNVDMGYLLCKTDIRKMVSFDKSGNYYMDPDTQKITDFLSKNPGHRVLFDASMKVSAKDVEKVAKMLGIFGEDDG
jgi:transcriptional regulator with XRE-family HTH domain